MGLLNCSRVFRQCKHIAEDHFSPTPPLVTSSPLSPADPSSPWMEEMEAEREIIHGDYQEEVKPPRRQWKAARGNREDKWTRKHRLMMEANLKKYQEELERVPDPEDEGPEVFIAMRYRDWWIKTSNGRRGSYEDTNEFWVNLNRNHAAYIPPMLYTDQPVPAPSYSIGCGSVVVTFSVRLTGLHKDLKWPLDVYGLVAARDSLDRNRNLIFNRSRDNCQTLTAEDDAALLLTGPSRAIIIIDPVHFEVELKAKGETPYHEDKLLSLLHIDDNCIRILQCPWNRVFCHVYSSKFCTVELTVGRLPEAVEATIAVRVVARISSCHDQDMVLLDSRHGPSMPIAGDGVVELSRCVSCVQVNGELTFCVDVWEGDHDKYAKDEIMFTPKRASKSKGYVQRGVL